MRGIYFLKKAMWISKLGNTIEGKKLGICGLMIKCYLNVFKLRHWGLEDLIKSG